MSYSLSVAAKLNNGQLRTTNEDNYYRSDLDQAIPLEKGQLFLAVDGVGGNRGGAIASLIACQKLPEHFFASKQANTTLVQRLEDAIKKTHKDIKRAGQQNSKYKEMSCTMVALAFCEQEVAFANLGDARIYRLRGESFKQLSVDHSMVQEQLEYGILTPEQAKYHPNKNVVTRTLGGSEQNEPDVRPLVILAGDRFVLCSDGLHDPVPDRQIASLLSQPKHVKQIADDLVNAANANGGPDNIVAMVVQAADPLDTIIDSHNKKGSDENEGPIGLVSEPIQPPKKWGWRFFSWK